MKNICKYYIGNTRKESKSALEVRNPYNNDVVGVTFLASEDDVNDAIQSAVRAFDETKKMPGFRRAEILRTLKTPSRKEARSLRGK